MAADDGGKPSVEVPPHRELLARGLRVPVEDAHLRRALAELRQQPIQGAEGIVLVRHEHAADRVHDESALRDEPATAGIARRKVQRTERVVERVDLLEERALVPHVVPVRDDIGAGRSDLVRDRRREPGSTGRVLAVHDREADLALVLDAGQQRRETLPPRPPDHVADEEDPHARTRSTYVTRRSLSASAMSGAPAPVCRTSAASITSGRSYLPAAHRPASTFDATRSRA